MKKRLLFFLLFFSANLLTAQPRQDYAVFFVASKFDNGLPELKFANQEVAYIAKVLKDNYNFQVRIVTNATRDSIVRVLAAYKQKKYGPTDQLLLFFSMHGTHEKDSDQGYLIPKNGLKTDDTYESWYSHAALRDMGNSIPCPRVLVALDACYSGIFGGTKAGDIVPDWETADYVCEQRIKKAFTTARTRKYLTAGGDTRVPSKSYFAQRWLAALNTNGGDDGLLSVNTLYSDYLKYGGQEPTFGDFDPKTAGDFVFASKTACGAAEPVPPKDPDRNAWDYARRKDTEDAYQFYIDNWKTGRYRREAQNALDRMQEERIWQAAVQKGAYDNYKAVYCPGGRHCSEADEKAKMPDDGLVLIRGGTFTMGCTSEQQDCGDDEKPAHSVTLGDFYIGRYEVTQKLWKEIMGTNPSGFKDCDLCPVEQVSWEDVQEFLTKLNARYPGRQYRLPTEAEWEYAARGSGKQVLFGNGKNVADPKEINFDASAGNKMSYSVAGLYRAKTVPVGSLNNPNALGLHDMSGNVWEWCSDWYDSEYYKNSPSRNPGGSTSGSYRVFRGGSWSSYPQYCRVVDRFDITPDYRGSYVGFRLARTF